MPSFEKTSLWRNSFENPQYQREAEALGILRESLRDMRGRAENLVSRISRDIPELTVHDVTHLDALWEIASLIAGDNYPLNPAEAYVFGGAVLIHDSAMSLAAYPNGLGEIKNTREWRDAVASRLKMISKKPISREQILNPSVEVEKAAIADFLREAHANRARDITSLKWPTTDGGCEFLIQKSELRETYGDIIGRIAASHWWPISQLHDLPPRVNAGDNIPAAWLVNPFKIACLLRVADIAHIDHRRAPKFLHVIVKPSASSDAHWVFQSKIGKPSIDRTFLVYTGSPFDINEAEAWWLGYDMLSSIDDELRAANGFLDGQSIPLFAASAVKGAKLPLEIAKVIPTKGWVPVNTELRVSNVPSLVELLGGERLYGAELSVPIREMIQNAADAIEAKRLVSDGNSDTGTIRVHLQRTSDGDFLEFSDNGIGMSSRVLTGALLDFGCSFWKSSSIRHEFPGLLSKGLKTTGRFGIGFFSIFMLGDRVTVTSRRYDLAAHDAHTLDFINGLRARPILRAPSPDEAMPDPGTRVRVVLRTRYDEPGGLLFKGASGDKKNIASLKDIVTYVSPAANATIRVEENENIEVAISANDWLTAEPAILTARLSSPMNTWLEQDVTALLPHLRPLVDPDTEEIHGRAFICAGRKYFPSDGVVTVGGFRASVLRDIVGVLNGEPETVARNSAMPTVTASTLRSWATEQAQLIGNSNISDAYKLRTASVVMLCGGNASCLPVVVHDNECLLTGSIEALLRNLDEVEVYEGDGIEYDEDDDVRPKEFENNFNVSPSLFLLPDNLGYLLKVGAENWPACIPELYLPNQPKCCEDVFHTAMGNAWGSVPDYDEESRAVGNVNKDDIVRNVRIYSRPLDLSECKAALDAQLGDS